MRTKRKFLRQHIQDAFPSYTRKMIGFQKYQWWKDGNRLGKRKCHKMNVELNYALLLGIRVYD